ncbi:dTMP kinase [Erythrobacter dokdonensis]|jgi:dTMP kinase|uniref:Thymidylate kinase n=1 Tax=Erythrobacter dokdonensis DSW-74 TaxID=1300349 RepID=A0A1A7BJE0_9SPHN|nr:dTMP kinase [Erythrobacter dokdonensis]MEE4315530.1 dTMP kinase [Erythrobacter sp.]OBV12589.1 Thymidylate kinase [Erythrobacter dokdonensis DSW-74]
MTAPGRFIALEGGEGAGKSTQSRLLAEALRARGLTVVTTREPGGTPGAEAIRNLLLAPPGEQGWTPEAEALLFAAARADHVAHLVRPALARGEWVVCDRFVDSSRAYQGGAGKLGDDAILALHDFGSDGLRPDRVILLEGDEAALAARLAGRGAETDAIEARSASYHRAVTAAFRAIAAADPAGFARIDGIGAPDDVHARIMAALSDLLEGAAG